MTRRRRLRDDVYRPSVARAITSPIGVVAGSAVAAGLLATGLPVGGAVFWALVAWAIPVIRAVRKGRPTPASSDPMDLEEVTPHWLALVVEAEQALERYRRALRRCPPGPLHDRLEDIESEFSDSVERCAELARWGADAELARMELDPLEVERAARDAGTPSSEAGEDQRDISTRLKAVEREARARLVLINGRLDEAVGRAVEMAGRARRGGAEAFDDAGALASGLRELRSALDEAEGLKGVQPRRAPDVPRRSTSAD